MISTQNQSYRINYNALKKAIRSSMIQKESTEFEIDMNNLLKSIENINLKAICIDTNSKPISTDSVPFIGEFFKGKNLTWIDQKKQYANIIFIPVDDLDEEGLKLFEQMNSNDESIDKTNVFATICANYSCYSAMVVSYISNDIRYNGSLCSEIIIRANTVIFKKNNEEETK